MPAIHESPVKRPLQELRQETPDLPINHRPAHSGDLCSSAPPSPSPRPPSPSPGAVKITTAFERVRALSVSLKTDLLKPSPGVPVTTRNHVKGFQDAVNSLFEELQHLPNNVPSTPALISAIQGCSFEVHCFGATAEIFRTGFGCEGWEERQKELVEMQDEAMDSMCILLELVAQAIQDAEAEQILLEASGELDTTIAQRGSWSGNGSSMGDRPLSWLVPGGAKNRDLPPLVSS